MSEKEAKETIRRRLSTKVAVYSVLVEENPELLDTLLDLQAKVFWKMHEKLVGVGFTREEAIDILKEGKPLIEVEI